jgi:MoaA/NifB/PqqE/SkfB family radical SAM enzyme
LALEPDTQVAPVQERARNPHVLETLPILVVHAHSSCNCRCVMCDIWKTKDAKVFGVGDLKPQLDSIRRLGVRWVAFSGGEPLMNAELPELCAILREEGVRLTLLTTGLLLKKCAQAVAANFDDVIISLDGPPEIHNKIRCVESAFALLQEGVSSLKQVRPSIPITARCTIQKANHHALFETARTAKLLGLNGISFLAADLTSSAFNRPLVWPTSRQDKISLSLAELAVLEDEIQILVTEGEKNFGSDFITESPEKLRRIVRHFRAHLGLAEAEAPLCNAPWVSAVIEADGLVRPCFFHPPIGKLQQDTTLEAVLNGENARNFRASLDMSNDPVCRNCVCSLNYRF